MLLGMCVCVHLCTCACVCVYARLCFHKCGLCMHANECPKLSDGCLSVSRSLGPSVLLQHLQHVIHAQIFPCRWAEGNWLYI